MAGRGQQTLLLGAALSAHLLLLVTIPPVVTSGSERSCPLRINVALAEPAAAKPVVPAAVPETVVPDQRQPAPSAIRQPPAPSQTASAAPAAPQPTQEPSPAQEALADPDPALPAASRIAGLLPAVSGEAGGLRLQQGKGRAAHSGPGQSTSDSPGGTGSAGSDAPTQPAVDTEKLLREYSSGVISRIRSQQRYPASAELASIEGKVKLSFTLAADGNLLACSVSESSGSSVLDSAALAAVQTAAPFAPIPIELNRSSAKLSVTLNFSLK